MKIKFFLIYGLGFLLSLAGCSKFLNPSFYSLSEAEKKLIEICRKDYNFGVTVKTAGNTVWVYAAGETPILSLKSTKKEDQGSAPAFAPSGKFSVLFVDGAFDQGAFQIEYDIIPATKSNPLSGYTTSYTDEYTAKDNNLTTAVYRAYSEAAVESLGDVSPRETRGDTSPFFVVVIADIKTGIETKTVFYFQDLKRYFTGALPADEYMKRRIFEVKGDAVIIGDTAGNHLEQKEISWPEFLTKQMIARINFKYQYSDLKPNANIENDICQVIHQAVAAYDFKDFTSVKLHNLREDKEWLFKPEDLKTFTE